MQETQVSPDKVAELSSIELSPSRIAELPRDISRLVITECGCSDWMAVFHQLRKLKHLKWVAIANCKLEDETVKQLVDHIPHCEWLSLDKNELTQASLMEIARIKGLEFLSLNDNHFNKDAEGPFIEMVCALKKLKEVHIKMPEVKHLVLENAHLDAREIEVLTHTFDKLVQLDLSGNKLTKEAIESIVENCKHLQELALRQCHLHDKDIEHFAGHFSKLETLYLNDNKITAVGIAEIAKHMPYLRRFYINKNEIGDDGAVLIASNNKLLMELGVVGCKIGERGIIAIAQGLPHLTKLFLYHDHMTDEAAECIVHNLKNLEVLDLDDTKVSDKAALMIGRHVPLKRFMVNKNHLKKETIEELAGLLPGAVEEPKKK